jgi:hypothetical protein
MKQVKHLVGDDRDDRRIGILSAQTNHQHQKLSSLILALGKRRKESIKGAGVRAREEEDEEGEREDIWLACIACHVMTDHVSHFPCIMSVIKLNYFSFSLLFLGPPYTHTHTRTILRAGERGQINGTSQHSVASAGFAFGMRGVASQL